ncbi:MAG: GNAT family N-acetyltransferase [Chloroflexota bacterium]
MPADIQTIRTERLELVSMSSPFMRAVLGRDRAMAEREIGAAIPPDLPDTLEWFLNYRLAQLEVDPTILRWLARAMVLTDADGTRRMIGTIGFHGAPDEEGRLEVGYRIEPEYRRQGYTREAVRGMFDWAATQGVHRFIASVRPANDASLALVRGFGFVQTGTQIDDIDGLEFVLEAAWPRPESAGGIA